MVRNLLHSFAKPSLVEDRRYQLGGGGGLAGSEVWNRVYISPQLRNLAQWDWVPFFFKTNMAENADMEGRWVFARFWVFPRPNSKKRFSRTFLMEFLDIRRRDVWTVHSHLSCFGISASSVVYKLREFSSNQPSLHLLYFSTYSGIKNSLPYPKHMLRAHYISMSLAIVRMGMFIKPIFYFAVRKFVCEPGAATNIYGRQYRKQGQFSKSQGKFSSHFALFLHF